MTELKTCIDQAVQDSTSYYLLGFYISQQDRKPGWHKLEVKLASEKGSVHARSSYYLAPRTSPSQKQIATVMRDAANAKIACWSARVQHSAFYIFSPFSKINEVRFGYSRYRTSFSSLPMPISIPAAWG